jgi:hypothetical protein
VTEDLGWVPTGVDTQRVSIARVYDYWLGGTHNFMADRDAARALIAIEPNTRAIMRANRDFLARAVRLMAESGIRQFLDIGSGIPPEGNVHEVAHAVAPDSRIVYVDVDEVAVAHSRAILSGSTHADVIQADLRDPDKILTDPVTQRLIDFREPVGLLLLGVLHFIPDDENPGGIVATLLDALASGSYLAISHGSTEGLPPETAATLQRGYNRAVSDRGTLRPRAGVEAFFDGVELLDPGVVPASQWPSDSPGGPPSDALCLCGVGRKP